jgi:hypothetical protein
LDQSIQNSFSSCAPTAYFEISMAQRMGLPLAPSLLQSALATRLPVRRSFCEGG